MTWEELKEALKKLPPMTETERKLQSLDFAYGNLACSTNHKPSRAAFKGLWIGQGFEEKEFDAWAAEKEWKP